MKISIAEYAGFCFGVERAIEIVYKVAESCTDVVTFGPIIHNPQVVSELGQSGVRVVNSVAEVEPGMTVVIRTHGIPRDLYKVLRAKASVVDVTCPFVSKVQEAANRLSEEGFTVVVVGESHHPEVESIVSFIDGEHFVVLTSEEAEKLPWREKYGIVAQTTQNLKQYKEIISIVKGKCTVAEAADTICSATNKRQNAAIKLAAEADAMIIAGGRNSANTTRLYNLCKGLCPRTYHIETVRDINDEMLAGVGHVGISAGASTPNNLVYNIQEYILGKANMNSDGTNNEDIQMEDFESMLEESLKQPTRGSMVKGVVTQIQGSDVIVNVGMKTEGVVDISELPAGVKINDPVELMVVGFGSGGGYMQLSSRKNAGERGDWSKDSVDKIVSVKIESHVEKGYKGKIGDIDAFIPENHIDLKSRIKDPNAYVGQTVKAKVLKISGSGKYKSALVSPKEYILEEGNKSRRDFLGKMNPGDVVKGVVKTLKEYGAFISFGPVDGFLHKSNMTWGRPKNPSKYMEEGQEITVTILEVNRDTGKIEVGLRQLTEDPWENARERFPIDSNISASVVGRRRNGFIAEIEAGVDAFIPLEELSWLKNGRVNINAKDVVEGRVLDYDNEHKRIIISVKMMSDNPWKVLKEEAPEGSVVSSTIKNITDFGLFVDFGYFIDGLIRKGDISWTDEPENLNTVFNVGDKVDAKVLRIDEDRERVSLGIKQLAGNPWHNMPKSSGNKGMDVTVSAVTKNGIEVELDNGIKGLIPQNELDPSVPSLDSYKPGDVLQATIIKSDQKERTVLLSVRKLIVDSERQETKEYMKKLEKSDENQGFGNVFKDIFKNE